MRFRLIAASLAAFLFCIGASAQTAGPTSNPMGQQQDTQSGRSTLPAVIPTPINSFADVAGWWWGEVDLTTKVSLLVGADGRVKLRGPASLEQVATINLQRLEIQSPYTDLLCNLVNGFLTCHARFGRTYAELNLRKAQQ